MTCNIDTSWQDVVSQKSSDFIRTNEEMDKFDWSSVLVDVTAEDIDEFKSHIVFTKEVVTDGKGEDVITRQGVFTFSVEILVTKYAYTPDQLEAVAATFGISREKFWKGYHQFGDLYPRPMCRHRPYFNCTLE